MFIAVLCGLTRAETKGKGKGSKTSINTTANNRANVRQRVAGVDSGSGTAKHRGTAKLGIGKPEVARA